MNDGPQFALVTGASSGLGAAIALELASGGWHVIAGSRPGAAVGDVPDRTQAITLDVNDEAAVRAVVDAAERQGRPISLLVANAGINVSGVVEEIPLALGRAVLETNFWGVVHAVRIVLPRKRKRRQGTVLVTGSLAGFRVRLAEPGFIQTALARSAPEVPGSIGDYAQVREALMEHWQASVNAGAPAAQMAQHIVDWALHGHGFRKRFGTDAIWTARLKRYLPEQTFIAGVRRRFGLSRLPAAEQGGRQADRP